MKSCLNMKFNTNNLLIIFFYISKNLCILLIFNNNILVFMFTINFNILIQIFKILSILLNSLLIDTSTYNILYVSIEILCKYRKCFSQNSNIYFLLKSYNMNN